MGFYHATESSAVSNKTIITPATGKKIVLCHISIIKPAVKSFTLTLGSYKLKLNKNCKSLNMSGIKMGKADESVIIDGGGADTEVCVHHEET